MLKTLLDNLQFLTTCDAEETTCAEDSPSLQTLVQDCDSLIKQIADLIPSEGSEGEGHLAKRHRLAWPLNESKARKFLDRLRKTREALNLELAAQSR